jgi:nonsense-mediated mRNA decay protein 3
MFCVECGRELKEEEELLGGICLTCFNERHPAIQLPPIIDLVRCPHCGAVYLRGGWRNVPTVDADGGGHVSSEVGSAVPAVEAAVGEALSVVEHGTLRDTAIQVRPEDSRAYAVEVTAEVTIAGEVVSHVAATRVRVRGEMCPVCSRRAGSYYEALVQFRGDPGRPATTEDLREAEVLVGSELERLSEASREVFLVKQEERHGGLDFFISTQAAGAQVARTLAQRFNAAVSTSTSMAGRKDGRDLVRVTHAVRMTDLRRGDYVMLKDELLRVQTARSQTATVEPAAGEGRRRQVARDDRSRLVVVGTDQDVTEAVVVSESPGELQVLDPVTLKTVELRIPPGYVRGDDETVRVLRVEDSLHLVD